MAALFVSFVLDHSHPFTETVRSGDAASSVGRLVAVGSEPPLRPPAPPTTPHCASIDAILDSLLPR